MINKEKIEYNVTKYWVPSHTGPRKIAIIEAKTENLYVVQDAYKSFVTDIEFIFNKEEHASMAKRDWEHAERKRIKAEKIPSKVKKYMELVDKVHTIVEEMKVNGASSAYVQVTKTDALWDGKPLIEFGFENDMGIVTEEDGNVCFLDGGQNTFVIDMDTVSSVRPISENRNPMVKCTKQFSYTTREHNRVRIYFDYKEQGE